MKFVLAVAMAGALASGQEASIRAEMRGGGDSAAGKCTGEVDVDGVVEVSLRGDEGRIRTLAGQPGRWKRLQCSAPMPQNMGEFKFKGVDGRGRQELARDPRSNNGVAVVRIEDTKGGSEGYTFDVEWRGGSGTWSGNNSGWGTGTSGRRGTSGTSGNNQGGWGNTNTNSGWGNTNTNSGWGNNNSNSGWGNNQGGWNNGWGSNFSYRGSGSGTFTHSNGQRQDLRGVNVTMQQSSGIVEVRLDTNVGREALVVTGQTRQINGETVVADITSARNRGETANATGTLRMTIGADRRVRSITVDGQAAGGRFNLNYRE